MQQNYGPGSVQMALLMLKQEPCRLQSYFRRCVGLKQVGLEEEASDCALHFALQTSMPCPEDQGDLITLWQRWVQLRHVNQVRESANSRVGLRSWC